MILNVTCPIERVKELILKENPNFYTYGEITQEAIVSEFVKPIDQENVLEYMRKTEKVKGDRNNEKIND